MTGQPNPDHRLLRLLMDSLDGPSLAELAARLQPHLAEQHAQSLLNTAEAAEILGIHTKTLTRAAQAGRVPGAQRVGKRWRFDASALELLPTPDQPVSAAAPRAPRRRRGRQQPTAASAIRAGASGAVTATQAPRGRAPLEPHSGPGRAATPTTDESGVLPQEGR